MSREIIEATKLLLSLTVRLKSLLYKVILLESFSGRYKVRIKGSQKSKFDVNGFC